MKNTWEEKANGRTERATAALAYYQERKKQQRLNEMLCDNNHNVDVNVASDEHKDSSVNVVNVSVVHDNALTNTMLESLSTALNATGAEQTEEIKERYTLIQKLPKVCA